MHTRTGRTTLALWLALAGCLAVGAAAPVAAAEYNKRPHLPPGAQAKINNTRARIFALEHALKKRSEEIESGKGLCRDRRTGVVVDRTNPRSERIIATRDIINLGGQLDLAGSCR
jgi:hypothetical protein